MENAARQMDAAQAAALARAQQQGLRLNTRRPGPKLSPADSPRVTLLDATYSAKRGVGNVSRLSRMANFPPRLVSLSDT